MAMNNSMKKLRSTFIAANKFQRDIVLLVFLPSSLIFLTFTCIVFIGNATLSKAIFHTTFLGMRNTVDQMSGLIIFLLCSFFTLSLIGAFVLSHNMVGGFGRVIKELDDVLAGQSQKLITSRPDDTLTYDLLKRVNVLVEYYVKHEKNNA